MIQAEVGSAARVDPGIGVQRPGFMIRDFTLVSNSGEAIRLSSFRGRSNLAVVFLGYSDAMRSFDKTHAVYKRSGAMDEDNCPIPLVYMTDRFNEIVSVYVALATRCPRGSRTF